MPPRPTMTGYERIAQADQYSDSDDDDPLGRSFASLQHPAAPRHAPVGQPRPHSGMASPKPHGGRPFHSHSYNNGIGGGGGGGRRGGGRRRSNSGVDLKAINARLERWADEIASKFKRHRGKKGGADEEERLEIHHSVFQAPEGVRPATAESLADPTAHGGSPDMSPEEFEAVVESVRVAIEQGVHPRMITQGSSGSYFARNPEGKVVGVFKPKDEEPYAAGNPKWNKWIHRNLFPCCFGRACLIPNLSYVSEAAAYVLDCQLRTHLVPYTDVVHLSSKSFHYPFWDRYAYGRNRKPLPSKPGSFQVFLKGFKDANIFLREHPWPDQYLSGFRTTDSHRNRRKGWANSCKPSGDPADGGDDESDGEAEGSGGSRASPRLGPGNFGWTESLKQSFREELEKLVILDYIMRNTDRGLDNWMIKVDWETEEVSIASEPLHLQMENGRSSDRPEAPRPVDLSQRKPAERRASYPYRKQQPMDASNSSSRAAPDPKISIGAIDNSLSWPWKHPDAWRSFPFGWLFLPVDLIGRPFSQRTRDHFLPLLTSTAWWSQTQLALRRVFQLDPDFQERMFARQIAVMKGQAWNVVETLKTADHGPLELTRRAKVCVWDDLVDVPVAVPMRVASSEMRRRNDPDNQLYSAEAVLEEEMDIGAANSSSANAGSSSASHQVDLLGLASPPADLPHPGRFELSLNNTEDAVESEAVMLSPEPTPGLATSEEESQQKRPAFSRRGGSANSYHQPPARSLNMYTPHHERRFSFATAAGRRNSNSIAQHLYGPGEMGGGSGSGAAAAGARRSQDSHGSYHYEDDMDGDLGYAAAEGMEGNRRKVIVERLEPVKTKNPVFTWC
ncbi:hypothetical protein RB597_006779 [Gaeumannomyces tritici]